MIIEGKSFQELKEESQEEFFKDSIVRTYETIYDQGHSKKEAMKLVAKIVVLVREIYQQLLEEKKNKNKRYRKYQFPYLCFLL